MMIEIKITHDDKLVRHAECLSVESAIAELGSFERHDLPKLDLQICEECGVNEGESYTAQGSDESRIICEDCKENYR